VLFRSSVSGRPDAIQPVGVASKAQGQLDHTLAIRRGALAGPWLGFSFGDRFPVRVRLGGGALLAWVSDTRSGTFDPVHDGPNFSVGPLSATTFVPMIYAAPDLRVGFRIGQRFELDLGADALVLVALKEPTWDGKRSINAGSDGIGTFPAERLMSRTLFVIAPGIGIRYDFL